MPRFTQETKARLDELISRYPDRRSALLPALWVAQEVYGGWLPEEAMAEVAEYLGVPTVEAEGVATFYSMYHKAPVGKHHIEICHNISCQIMGADDLVHHCERRLGIHAGGEITPDGMFSLARVECLGACCNTLVVQVGPKYYENMDAEKVDRLIDELRTVPSTTEHPAQARMPEQRMF